MGWAPSPDLCPTEFSRKSSLDMGWNILNASWSGKSWETSALQCWDHRGSDQLEKKSETTPTSPDTEPRYNGRSQYTWFPCIPQSDFLKKLSRNRAVSQVPEAVQLCSRLRIPRFTCKPGRHLLCYLSFCTWRFPFFRAILSARGSLITCPKSANPCFSHSMADFRAKEGG